MILFELLAGGRETRGHFGQQLLPRGLAIQGFGRPGQPVAGDFQAQLRKLRIGRIIGQESRGQLRPLAAIGSIRASGRP